MISEDRPSVPTQMNLRVGDCVAEMEEVPEKSIDVVVTSPPYNRGILYRSYVDRLSPDEYFAWTSRWTTGLRRILCDNGSFFLNVGGAARDALFPHEVAIVVGKAGFQLQNTIHWIKAISIDRSGGEVFSKGHFRPVTSRYHVNNCHEYVFHFTKSGRIPLARKAIGVPYTDKSNIRRWVHADGEDRRCRGNTWFIPYPTIRSRDRERPHPATFPVKLAEWCLRLHGKTQPVVLDPFMGIGSTAVAAKRVNAARFIGFELEAEYVAWAHRRVEEGE